MTLPIKFPPHSQFFRIVAVLFLAHPLFGYDFSLKLDGPQTATPGFPLYLQIQTSLTEGERMWVHYESEPFDWSLLGPGTNPSWGNSTWSPTNVTLRLDIPADLRPGSYTVKVKAESGGVVHTASWQIEAEVPKAFARRFSNATSSAKCPGLERAYAPIRIEALRSRGDHGVEYLGGQCLVLRRRSRIPTNG